MVDFRPQGSVVNRAGTAVDVDEGLRKHMLRVYNYMTLGLGLTGAVAFAVATVPALRDLFWVVNNGRLSATLLGFVVMFAPLAFILVINFGLNRMKTSTVQALFWAFAAAMGASLSNVLLIYTGVSVARTFFITAAAFGALSLYGYTTKRDLSALGKFLFIGLIGLIIAMIVNLFLQAPALQFAISAIGVLIFAGLTAFDTQKIKEMYLEVDGSEVAGKKAIMGALTLYLDFILMFQFLLFFMGGRD
ncbi:MAG TPA: Bax inhibitor-1/YccA family protein [Alphaproteobacteria bacterium]|nr:Bax inhibitor-1/YccA family protein [Alphaproteobacteria bacterium]